ncbi:unnamed protein product [Closterium sp. Naga37s-1]|nr:unnamed protein product [Closterium sp. Naga37s-1]
MPTYRKSHAILLLRSAFLIQLTFSLVAFAASPATFPPQPSGHRTNAKAPQDAVAANATHAAAAANATGSSQSTQDSFSGKATPPATANATPSAAAIASPSPPEVSTRRRLVEEQGIGGSRQVPEKGRRQKRERGRQMIESGRQGSAASSGASSGVSSGAVRLKCPPISSQSITPGMVLLPNCSLAIASPEDGLKAWEGRNGEGKQGPGEEGEEEGDGAEEEEVEEVGGEGEGKGVRYGGGRGWAGRVVELRGVWVDGQGRVFNASHLFWLGGCGRRRSLSEWLHVMAPHYLGAPPHSLPPLASRPWFTSNLSAFSNPIPSAFSIPILPLPSQWLHVMASHYLGEPLHQVTLLAS